MDEGMPRRNPTGSVAVPVRALLSKVLTWLPWLAPAAILGYAFAELSGGVRSGDGFAFDRSMMDALHGLASPGLTVTMRLITNSASGLAAAGAALAVALYLWWTEWRTEAVILLVTLASSAALGQGLKVLFARPRPHLFPWLTAAPGWSFPSGHTLTAVVLGGLLTWLAGLRLSGWWRVALEAIIGLWIGLVGLSRVYLGVHYPSDVVASLVVGGLCLLATVRRSSDRSSHAT